MVRGRLAECQQRNAELAPDVRRVRHAGAARGLECVQPLWLKSCAAPWLAAAWLVRPPCVRYHTDKRGTGE